jgi:hypothetical protein
MIEIILDMLKHAKGETENIRIAQGKHRLPLTIKEGYKTLKQDLKWQ